MLTADNAAPSSTHNAYSITLNFTVSFRQTCYQGLLGLRLPSLTKRVISEERVAVTPRVTQPSDLRATPCAQADRLIMRRLRVAVASLPRSSADRSASIRRAGLRPFAWPRATPATRSQRRHRPESMPRATPARSRLRAWLRAQFGCRSH